MTADDNGAVLRNTIGPDGLTTVWRVPQGLLVVKQRPDLVTELTWNPDGGQQCVLDVPPPGMGWPSMPAAQ